MSTTDPTRAPRASTDYTAAEYGDRGHGDGWVLFAGTMLLMLGVLNIIDGIAAISNSKFFTANATYVISSLNTWGWVVLILGVIQILTGLGVWGRVEGVRWVGVAIAGLNAIAQLLFIPAYPFWSLALFTLDILVIYGLIAYGAKPRTA